MPRAYLCELRDDVVVVAGRRESGVLWKQIAEDSGIAEASLRNWLKRADIEGSRPGQARDETDQVRELRGGAARALASDLEDSGMAEASLRTWLKRADIEGSRPGQARDETDQVRELRGGAAWALASQVSAVSSSQRTKQGKSKKTGPPVFDDLVTQLFTADAPNRL